MRHDADALRLHGGGQAMEDVVLLLDQRMRLFVDLQKALLGKFAFLCMLLRGGKQIGHAHFEVFVQIG